MPAPGGNGGAADPAATELPAPRILVWLAGNALEIERVAKQGLNVHRLPPVGLVVEPMRDAGATLRFRGECQGRPPRRASRGRGRTEAPEALDPPDSDSQRASEPDHELRRGRFHLVVAPAPARQARSWRGRCYAAVSAQAPS